MLSRVHNGVVRTSRTSRVPLSSLRRTTTILLPSSIRTYTCAFQQRSRSSPLLSTPHATSHDTRQPRVRSYATLPENKVPQDIAVLGGGLTGLTTAHYLTVFNPDANITIYEADERLGGWVDTERISVKTWDGKDATITFDRGARTVAPQSHVGRWDDFILYEMILQLGLLKHQNTTPYALPKYGTSLNNRYIYYPDHLVPAPGGLAPGASLWGKLGNALKLAYMIMTEPVYKDVSKLLWRVAMAKAKLKDKRAASEASRVRGLKVGRVAIANYKDISVGEFLLRIAGSREPVNNLASAFFHGIWGGDVWKLSAPETTMQDLYFRTQVGGTGLLPVKDHDYDSGLDIWERTPGVWQFLKKYGSNCSYIGFHNGFGTLSDAIADALKRNPKVTIKTGSHVTSITHDSAKGKAVVESTADTLSYDKVISSLYSGTLAKLTGDSLPALKNSKAVTIQIVNLWYPDPTLLSRNPGFGYLIPQSVPAEQNPHAALGVIFDSERDKAARTPEYMNAPGTKLTVMLGGHYWDSRTPAQLPAEHEAIAMAIDTVERQLGIPATAKVYSSAKLCRDCIPQHVVGHRARMGQAHTELYDAFRGTLAVVGGSYTSPGVLPTLKAARDMALKVAGKGYKKTRGKAPSGAEPVSLMAHVGETGLGKFYGTNETFRFLPMKALAFRKDRRGAL